MSEIDVDVPVVDAHGVARGRTVTGHDRARWILIVLTLVLGAYAILFGVRSADYDVLEGWIAAGEIESITITPGIEPGVDGSSMQRVEWSRDWRDYRTTVRMVTASTVEQDGVTSRDEGVAVLEGHDVADILRAMNPDLWVEYTDWPRSESEVLGYSLPPWAGPALLAIALCSLGLLISGQEPWRASKWAWFWIMANPVGLILFLVLSGPTPVVPAPKDPDRRLTGGWALILSWLLPAN